MRRGEIRTKFDQIVEFAGLAEFIDTPVKRYSSGMYARLGFSVAAHVEPDLLIVDEVLSVGDYLFQKKCGERMAEIIQGGATVIFVSHNLRAIAELCRRSMLLEKGRVAQIGNTNEVIANYLNRGQTDRGAEGTQDVFITEVRLRQSGDRTVRIEQDMPLDVEIDVSARRSVDGISLVLDIKDTNFYLAFNSSTERLGLPPVSLRAGESLTCTFQLDPRLVSGSYHVDAFIYRHRDQREFDHWRSAATFFVAGNPDVRGVVDLRPRVRIEYPKVPAMESASVRSGA
jgi:lipopolysaccharide transport system ATP-binding protein